ncbi:MAG: hypothetical protein ACLP1X_30685, partial [Polyangiaceae bacterium]
AELAKAVRGPTVTELLSAVGGLVQPLSDGVYAAQVGRLEEAEHDLVSAELYSGVHFARPVQQEVLRIHMEAIVVDARKHAAAGEVDEVQDDLNEFKAKFGAGASAELAEVEDVLPGALRRRGLVEVDRGQFDQAVADFTRAYELNRAVLSGRDWNRLCWRGSLHGHAPVVLFACERAVSIKSDSWQFRDSRGVALALSGDVKRAIDDFDFVVKHSHRYAKQRREWMDSLRASGNPFKDEKTLKEIETE